MASGDTLAKFFPRDNEPPASAYAVLGLRNLHPTLDFNDTTQWAAIFTDILARNYAGGGITVFVHWAAVAVTGNVGWDVSFERIGDSILDVDADSFATAQVITAATVPATSGHVDTTSVAITNGANIASIAVGELYRLRVRRNVATDTAVGNAQVFGVELKET